MKSQKFAFLTLLILLLASLGTNIYFIQQKHSLNVSTTTYIFPYLSYLSDKQFSINQKFFITGFKDLRSQLTFSTPEKKDYAVYFESLNSGAWIGVHERTPFASASLRKVPLAAAIYKAIENGVFNIEDVMEIRHYQTEFSYNPKNLSVERVPLKELLFRMLNYSDNDATIGLSAFLGDDRYIESLLAMGISYKKVVGEVYTNDFPLSPKEFSNILRTLYYSSFLTREHSELILKDMIKTKYEDGLPKGVPTDIEVAHKMAYWIENQQHHDCGIVYYPNSPYILCVMTKGYSQDEANAFTAKLSKIVYDYVDERIH